MNEKSATQMFYTTTAYLFGSNPEIRRELAKKMGKKHTSSDIALYSYEKQFLLEIVDPIQYPTKPLVLFQTANMLDVPIVILSPSGPDASTGEFALLLEALGIEHGVVAVVHSNEYVNINDLKDRFSRIFKELFISRYRFIEVNLENNDHIVKLRDIIHKISLQIYKTEKSKQEVSKVEVDHVFPVKGIGTVILGRVRSGKISKGSRVLVLTTQRTCIVKSIQINDIDYNSASFGSRVGLALRGILPKDVRRGYILTSDLDGWVIRNKIKIKLKTVPFAKLPEVGKTRHIVIGLQAIPAVVSSIKAKTNNEYLMDLELTQEVVFRMQDRLILIDLNDKPKTIGYAFIVE